jgi:hypothetical protein
MKYLASTFLSLFIASASIAQTPNASDQAGTQVRFAEDVFGLGLHASLTSGMGISFKHHLANIPFAYQITGGIWKSQNHQTSDIGLEAQYDLSVSGGNRLYAVLGFGHYYSGDSTNELDGPTRIGLGFGYELPFSKAINVSANLLVTSFQPTGEILPLPSIGMHIYFK